tara:strand:- start:73 stop:987 length:915 start_codon:yes stop_codon:yes gene_type:complete
MVVDVEQSVKIGVLCGLTKKITGLRRKIMFSSPITRRAITSQDKSNSFDLNAALRYMNDKSVKHLNTILPNLGLRRFESHICTLTHDPFPKIFPGIQPRVGIEISIEIAFKFFVKFLEKKGIRLSIMRHEDTRALDPETTIETIIIYKKELEAKLSSKDFPEFIADFDIALQRLQPVLASTISPVIFDLNTAIAIINDHIKEFWYALGVEEQHNKCSMSNITLQDVPAYKITFCNETAEKSFTQFLTSYDISYKKDRSGIIVIKDNLEKSLRSDDLVKLVEFLQRAFDDYMVIYRRESGMFSLC